jgi:hypothetical protein
VGAHRRAAARLQAFRQNLRQNLLALRRNSSRRGGGVSERRASRPLAESLVDALELFIAELVDEALERRLGDLERAAGWLTVEEYAELKRTTPAAVHKRLERGQIIGAERESRRWLIPAAAAAATLPTPDKRGPRRANGRTPGTRRS